MRLATFTSGGATHVGVVIEDDVVDLARAAPDLPRDMLALLSRGAAALEAAGRAGHQLWFNKQVTCINAPFAPIVFPRVVSETKPHLKVGDVVCCAIEGIGHIEGTVVPESSPPP